MSDEHENKLIVLEDATIIAHSVVAVAKMQLPATLQTPVVPYVHVILRDAQPLSIPCDTDEEQQEVYTKIVEAIKSW